ncbi:putative secondary metabolism biosynthetic enzyme [Lecanicillium sp. MT-2017a]|nr:putative secondary metabolism biosynthetic enzyme [Lecanicillium sp. MT-2017a]
MAVGAITQKALVGDAKGEFVLSDSAPVPLLEDDDFIAVSVKAVSLNPIDTKMVGGYHTTGAVSGCDFAGIVTDIGSVVSHIKVGDRVAGAIPGMNPRRPSNGAFSEKIVAPSWATVKIPDSWTFAEGSSLGTSWMTSGMALFWSLGLPLDGIRQKAKVAAPDGVPVATNGTKKPIQVLVSGGASAAGTAVIQLLKLGGFYVIATCSTRSNEMVKSYGADEIFDYNSSTCAADIKAATRNSLKYAIDCVTTSNSTQLCYSAIGRAGGRYTALDPYSDVVAVSRPSVKATWVLGPELLGEDLDWPAPHGRPGNADAKRFCGIWASILQGLLDRRLIRTHPLRVSTAGLQDVLQGFEAIREKKISGEKLVYAYGDV